MILYCNNFNATVLHPRCLCNGRLLTVFSIDGDDTKTIFPTTNSRRPLNPRRICRSLPQTQRYIYGLSLPASPAAVTSPPPLPRPSAHRALKCSCAIAPLSIGESSAPRRTEKRQPAVLQNSAVYRAAVVVFFSSAKRSGCFGFFNPAARFGVFFSFFLKIFFC